MEMTPIEAFHQAASTYPSVAALPSSLVVAVHQEYDDPTIVWGKYATHAQSYDAGVMQATGREQVVYAQDISILSEKERSEMKHQVPGRKHSHFRRYGSYCPKLKDWD